MKRNWMVHLMIVTHLVWAVVILLDNKTILSPFVVQASIFWSGALNIPRDTFLIQILISATFVITSVVAMFGIHVESKSLWGFRRIRGALLKIPTPMGKYLARTKNLNVLIGFALLLPQQFVIMMTTTSILFSVWNRVYNIIVSGDAFLISVLFPGRFIIDMSSGILVAIFHTISILNFVLVERENW